MINNDTAKSIYTVTEGVTEYPIGFQYTTNSGGTPNLRLWDGDGVDLEYGTDYKLSDDGLSIVLLAEIAEGTTLNVAADEPFIQDSDYVVGRIDPEQIERDFDKSVLRDLELRDYALDTTDRLDDVEDTMATYGDIVTHDSSEFVLKTGDTMSGTLAFGDATTRGFIESLGGDSLYFGGEIGGNKKYLFHTDTYYNGLVPMNSGQQNLGAPSLKWGNVYATKINTTKINNGADLSIPITGGTLARIEDMPTTAAEVHALPDTTKYAASIRLSIDPSTFVVTAQLKDQDNNNIGTAQTIDLPLESVVVSGAYDSATKEVVLTLEGGSTVRFSVADLVSGLQTEITSSNKLDADLVDDSTSAHKFVSAAEKGVWNSKQDSISDLATIRSGAAAGATALQSGDNVSELTNDAGYLTSTDVAADYVAKTGDTMTGDLTFSSQNCKLVLTPYRTANYGGACIRGVTASTVDLSSFASDKLIAFAGLNNLSIKEFAVMDIVNDFFCPVRNNVATLGHSQRAWANVYTTKINNGADIAVPTSGGTMARIEDLPSIMTGADGTNAGTSGLVPAPAATDNDKFLSGDGTWKAAGGGATYTAGTGISIDANNEISVAAPTLTNKGTVATNLNILGDTGVAQTRTNAVSIGYFAAAKANNSVSVGANSGTDGQYALAIGQGAYSGGTSSSAIGCGASIPYNVTHAVQIGCVTFGGQTNNPDSNTFKVANANGNFEIMSADGTIPTARLTKVNTTVTLAVADWSSNTQTVTVSGVKADSVVFVSPDPASASDYASAGILCTAQAAGTLTFTCDTVPSNAITVNVVCL